MIANAVQSTAATLDVADPLAKFRDRFVFADAALLYLDGNSLGRLPVETARRLRQVTAEQWGARLIRGWSEGWLELAGRIGGKIAGLLGAQPHEVLIADSTSVNLFKLATAALHARPDRHKIITDDLNFPSDLYVLQGLERLLNRPLTLEVIPSPDGIHGPVEGLAAAIDEQTALVTLSHTVFKSAYTYDMAALTRLAHDAGALTLWDLSHSAGSVLVDLNGSGADLAVGCCYKYLNGGPGAPAFLYVREDLQEELRNPIQGWMGADRMFDFGLTYAPAPGLTRFLSGTPPILSTAAIEPGVDLLREAGMEAVRAKSVAQTEFFIELWQQGLAPLGFSLRSPREAARRGSHVTLGHPHAQQITAALIDDADVLPDFRSPDNIRFGIAPLYTKFAEIEEAVGRVKRVVSNE